MCTTTWAIAPWQQVATYGLASKYCSFAKQVLILLTNYYENCLLMAITTMKERQAAMMTMTSSIMMTILYVLTPQHCSTPSDDIFVVTVSLFH